MTSRATQLLRDALELATEERAAVAAELLAGLDSSEPHDAADIEAAWSQEIERRVQRVLSGESAGTPWEEVRRRIEDNLTS
jgi:putative addiction module component (TIGR02574 family)